MIREGFLGRTWSGTWRITIFLILWGALYALLLVPWLASEDGPELARPASQLYVNATGAATVLLAAWLALRFFDRRPFASLGFRREGAVPELATGLVVGLGMMALSVLFLWVAGWAGLQRPREFPAVPLLLAAVSMLLNSLIQEVLFRGYILQTIAAVSGPRLALILSSVLFVAAHGGAAVAGFAPALNLLLAGMLLGLGYLLRGNLWFPLGLHFGWNFLQGPVLGMAVTGHRLEALQLVTLTGPPLATGGDFGLEGGLVATAVTALGILFLVLLDRRRSAAVPE